MISPALVTLRFKNYMYQRHNINLTFYGLEVMAHSLLLIFQRHEPGRHQNEILNNASAIMSLLFSYRLWIAIVLVWMIVEGLCGSMHCCSIVLLAFFGFELKLLQRNNRQYIAKGLVTLQYSIATPHNLAIVHQSFLSNTEQDFVMAWRPVLFKMDA